jgi:2-C-methyl-D-erythritol 4-phosphate cytidylyltransferase
MKNVAVILAGGKGTRLGSDKPKQFLKVAGKLIIEHTIIAFQNHKLIDEIAVVCHKNYISIIEDIVNINQFSKVKRILNGGEQRSDSSLSAINAYSQKKNINLIFHDAVRPLVSEQIITNCINALSKYNAVAVAVSATDTILEVNNNFITDIPNRSNLQKAQTPQAFKLDTIKKAYNLGLKDLNFQSTDDCGVVKKYLPDEPICVVSGEETNMKLTYEEDLFLLDKLLQVKTDSMKK